MWELKPEESQGCDICGFLQVTEISGRKERRRLSADESWRKEIGRGHILPYKIVQCPNTFLLHSFTPQINSFTSIWWYFFASLENWAVIPECGAIESKCSPLGAWKVWSPGLALPFQHRGPCLAQCVPCLCCLPECSLGSLATPFSLAKHSEASAGPFSTKEHEHWVLWASALCLSPAACTEKCPRVIAKANALSSHLACFITVQSRKALAFG